jgi:uncharacterized protein (DUF2384 family)
MPAPQRAVISQSVELLPGENTDIRVDVGFLLENADVWLKTPNTRLDGRTPQELIGTPDEVKIRNILRGAVYSSMA